MTFYSRNESDIIENTFNSPQRLRELAKYFQSSKDNFQSDFYKFWDDFYKHYQIPNVTEEATRKFLSKFGENSTVSVESKIKENEIYFYDFLYEVLTCIFDQNKIEELINKISNEDSKIYELTDIGIQCVTFSLYADTKSHFFLQKKYTEETKLKIEDEIEIYKKEYISQNNPNVFIMHYNNNKESNKIYLPYYENINLHHFLIKPKNMESNKPVLKLTREEKLTMIIEIISALETLNDNGISCLSLNDSSIFISRRKDAYISSYLIDMNSEIIASKLPPQNFYRHPEFIDFLHDNKELEYNNQIDDEKKLKYVIYSIGAVIHQIVTERDPRSFFQSTNTRCSILNDIKNKYFEVLFNDASDDEFDNKYGITGICSIIKKCMETKNDENTFKSLSEVKKAINKIIKNYNLEEYVNYRIRTAISPYEYQCTIIDIIYNYLSGNSFSKTIIERFIEENLKKFEKKIQLGTDLIADFLEFLKLIDLDFNWDKLVYEELFDMIIRKQAYSLLELNHDFIFTENQKKLIQLSINFSQNQITNQLNNYYSIRPLKGDISNIIPIASLYEYINSGVYLKISTNTFLIFSYILAYEISVIHSYDIFHGKLSLRSIGVFYNRENYSFVPLIIPFYYFFVFKKRVRQPESIPFKQVNHEAKKRKDISALKNILFDIKEKLIIDKDNDLIEEILGICSCFDINSIVNKLYNLLFEYNLNELLKEYIKKENYKLTFSLLARIYYDKSDPVFKIFNEFQITNAEKFLNANDAINYILNFTNEKLDIKQDVQENNYESSLFQIKSNICTMLNQINNYYYICAHNIQKKPKKEEIKMRKIPHLVPVSYEKHKMVGFDEKIYKMKHKLVFRTLEIYFVTQKSTEFLVKRYINNLAPDINFRINLIVYSKNPHKYDGVLKYAEENGHKTLRNSDGWYIFINHIGPDRYINEYFL